MARHLLFVFDIDETLIHYIPSRYYDLWSQKQHLFSPDLYVEIPKASGSKDVILFRPHLDEFFKMVKENPDFYKTALWTYSEREYCNDIANVLSTRYDLGPNFFLFLKGAEDVYEDEDHPKNLNFVFRDHPEFNVFNTVLVDDRYGNIRHSVNQNNGLLIQPYAPFGVEKQRELFDDAFIKEQLADTIFVDVMKIANALKTDIQGCDPEDFEAGFRSEPVFISKRITRMGLDHYYQSYAVKPQSVDNIISLGTPYLTKDFVVVKGNVALNVHGKTERVYTRGRSRSRSKTSKRSKSKTRSRSKTSRSRSTVKATKAKTAKAVEDVFHKITK